MLHKISNKFADYIVSHSKTLVSAQKDHIRFATESLISEFSKFIILLVCFTYTGHGRHFLFAFVILSLLRLWGGGLHFKTYMGCLLSTAFMYSLIIWMPFDLTYYDSLIYLFSLIAILVFVPISDVKRPSRTTNELLRLKILSAISLIILVLTINTIQQFMWTKLFLSSITIFTLQLMIGGFIYEKQKRV